MPGLFLVAFAAVVAVSLIVVPIRIVILWRRGEFNTLTFESLSRLVESEMFGPFGCLFALAGLLFVAMFLSMLL